MEARGEEVRDDHDALHTASHQPIGSLFQTGSAEFQEGGFDDRIVARACQIGGGRAHGLVRRFDARAVGEDDDSGGHALLMYCRMWWISSFFSASSKFISSRMERKATT